MHLLLLLLDGGVRIDEVLLLGWIGCTLVAWILELRGLLLLHLGLVIVLRRNLLLRIELLRDVALRSRIGRQLQKGAIV